MEPRILVVSPHGDDVRALTGMLDLLAVGVAHATDVQQARERLGLESFGAVVVEAQLADGTWLDVLASAHQSPRPPAVIVTRAHADARTWVHAIESGAYDLLPQPFHAPEVRRILERALGLTGGARAAGR